MKLPLALSALLSLAAICPAKALATDLQEYSPMEIQTSYSVVVTDHITDCRDFYVRNFGFKVVFESTWFIYLESPGERHVAVAFMTSDHPSHPPGPERFSGEGMFLTLQVADARQAHDHLEQSGARIAYPLADEPWGQQRFGLRDPSGMWVDVVEQIDPAPGFWDPYMPAM